MKKYIMTLILVVLLLFGCGKSVVEQSISEFNSHESITLMPDESIVLSGNVYENTAREFERLTMTGKKHYTVRIHTNGGDAFSTVAMVHRIKDLQKQGVKFTMIVKAKAFSAGSYLFMMGDERIMYNGSLLMWHTVNGKRVWYKKARSEERGVVFDTIDNFIVGEFEKKFPDIPKEKVNHWFWNTDLTWMTSTEALLWGIATQVIY
jgi:ATP-dependent protease ClpP protease subunit